MIRQQVFVKLPFSQLKDHFTEIVSAGYSVSLFTDWQSESINEVWIKSKVDPEIKYRGIKEFYGAKAAIKDLHPIIELSAENCTPQWAGRTWYDRLFKWIYTQQQQNYSQNILFPGSTPLKPYWRYRKWANKSGLIYSLQKSGPSRQTSFG
jgi:xylitol oxidase